VYWNRQRGTVVPVDQWIGLRQKYSPGVRELSCREAAGSSFRRAREDLERVGQLCVSAETLRGIVEAEGQEAQRQQRTGALGPDWTAQDCRGGPDGHRCVITGADGVKVPLVTEAEKAKRRQRRRKGVPHRPRLRRGSDQRYKEFKIVTFYDPSSAHQYAVGTSGNHQAAGRLMRREGRKLRLDQADQAYSVSDGADWIYRQYRVQLPMLQANVLDYYHLREHVTLASQAVFGPGTSAAQGWREQICGMILEEGPTEVLASLAVLRKSLRAPGKRKALSELMGYISRRLEMLQYPQFRAAGYEIGSGPTEAFCKTLTSRLKGPGMRWDKHNAEALIALASVRSSHLWQDYWAIQRKAVA
jgi:hypothetical protein